MRLYAYVQICHLDMVALAVLPVLLGLALASQTGPVDAFVAVLSVLFVVIAQSFCNTMNDWVDFRSGNDYPGKPGMPKPLVDGRLTEQEAFRFATFLGGAMILLGVILVHVCLPWICFPFMLIPAAAWALTGKPPGLDYKGFSEILVFLLFGWGSAAGAFWLQRSSLSMLAAAGATMTGLLAVNVLIANGLRDFRVDEFSRKRTLAVMFGRRFALAQYSVNAVIAACLFGWLTNWNWTFAVLLFAFLTTREMRRSINPRRLNELLNNTLVFTIASEVAAIIYLMRGSL